MTDAEFAERGRALVSRFQKERSAERALLAECASAIAELLASGEPLTERSRAA